MALKSQRYSILGCTLSFAKNIISTVNYNVFNLENSLVFIVIIMVVMFYADG